MNTVKITKTINGVNVKDMSKEELLASIVEAENDIMQLSSMATETEYATAQIAKCNAFIEDAVALLDA